MESLLAFLKAQYPEIAQKWEQFQVATSDASASGSPPSSPTAPSSPSSPSSSNEECSSSEDLSDTSDSFTEVRKSKKRRRRGGKDSPPLNPKAAKLSPPPVIAPVAAAPATASPRPSVAAPAAPTPSHSAMEVEQVSPTIPAPKAPRKPPPVIIQDKSAWNRVSKAIYDKRIFYSSARTCAQGIRVQTDTPAAHRALTAFLRNGNIDYHTYALEDERMLRVVIIGLPTELDTDEIKQDLISKAIPAQEVHRMYHPRTKRQYNMVLVVLPLTPEGKAVFNLKTVCNLSGLRIEPPRKRGSPGQCHRCQLYGHSARNCFAKPRCVKCLGDHGTSDCPRRLPTEEPPSCVLCNMQGHTANYMGCPKAPRRAPPRASQRGPPKGAKKAPAAPAPPAEGFVPAPPPKVNAWSKPLVKKASPAQPSPPVAPLKASSGKPAPRPQAAAPSSGFGADLAFVSEFVGGIDADELRALAQKLRGGLAERLEALVAHSALIEKIKCFAPSRH